MTTDSKAGVDRIERLTVALMDHRGFRYAEDPMEYGQDAYDITNEMRAEVVVLLNALGEHRPPMLEAEIDAREKIIASLRAENAALASTARAGAGDWVTVPRTASKAMLDAAYAAHDAYEAAPEPKGWGGLGSIYKAMIEAASAVPASPRSGAGEKVDQALLRELSDLADWLERDSSENDADNVRAAVSALSQGGGAGRSERAVEIRELSEKATTEPPCHWGGGNDIIWCSTCGAEYAYAKGEERPPCPRSPAPAQSPSTSDAEG